ncbi:extracellular solute-binding protein [Paenibacillus sp. XY044]|uniref:extracellular solute-binding protein n=1 Tax=Paenibacillus sp. XY044 TaxID=2026089 RepID=UPI000B98A9CA|nr:extracellular solute-binding protein [Paenibacillus sp. XY044]OZB91324.1 ABC transporter substrate-binding protein [Paenibacillus sp. XY044]
MRRSYLKVVIILAALSVVVYAAASLLGDRTDISVSADRLLDSSRLINIAATSYQEGSYDGYLAKHKDAKRPETEVMVKAENYSKVQGMNITVLDPFEGTTGKVIQTGDSGTVEWELQVDQDGLYNIALRYFTVKGKDSDVERELKIDGSYPFAESKSLVFSRVWKNEKNEFDRDGSGNDLTPVQVEVPQWQESLLKDATGYYEDPYLFYFSKGKHVLSLTSVKEPLVIDEIKLTNPPEAMDYDDLANLHEQKGYKPAKDVMVKVQGEAAAAKSSPTLLPYNDRSNPAIEPFSVTKLRNNAIGGAAWKLPGQWIEWEVDVPEDGLYQIAIKSRQNYLNGMSVIRTLYIDDEIPFKEAKRIGFGYDSSWQMKVLGKDHEHPYMFYLTKGKHRVKLEATLGDLAPIIRQVQSSILELNAMYRQIISFTGTVPDTYRDYNLEQRIPEMVEVFRKQSSLLYEIAGIIEGPGGKRTENSAMLNTLAYQLQDMADRPDTVPSRLDQFKSNVGGLGTWLLGMNEQPLAIDFLTVSSPDVKLPAAEAGSWRKLEAGVASFAASFYENYDSYDSEKAGTREITVWMTPARDQAQVIKRLINDKFTPQTGIKVNLRLVSQDILLPSTLTGEGPDVALQVDGTLPVNYASRGALQDLSVFPDFSQVVQRFNESAMVPYEYNDGYYALPETQTFPVLFYRKDIIEDELKLKVPQTWDEVFEMIPALQKHNLEFGLPQKSLDTNGNDSTTSDISRAYTMFLYQHDGQLYKDGGKASALDTETAIREFKRWTDLYVNYKLPIQLDFSNRFRTGEMPIGIIDYTMFNKLSVFAPEIKGLWSFTSVPGVKMQDGTIRREVGGSGVGTVMFQHTKDKDAAWEFMKWWTSQDTQATYGREMEVRLGSSARYPTANMDALAQLPWQTKDFQKLAGQMQWVQGIPEVPGGYLTGRNLDNAFRAVVVQGEDPRETIEYYTRYINEEITSKRKEFKLPYEN